MKRSLLFTFLKSVQILHKTTPARNSLFGLLVLEGLGHIRVAPRSLGRMLRVRVEAILHFLVGSNGQELDAICL